jgi:hypothetical protein
MKKYKDWKNCLNPHLKSKVSILIFYLALFMLLALTSICVVLPVTSALMTPLPPSYNLCATNCAKELTSPLEEGLSVSQPPQMP